MLPRRRSHRHLCGRFNNGHAVRLGRAYQWKSSRHAQGLVVRHIPLRRRKNGRIIERFPSCNPYFSARHGRLWKKTLLRPDACIAHEHQVDGKPPTKPKKTLDECPGKPQGLAPACTANVHLRLLLPPSTRLWSFVGWRFDRKCRRLTSRPFRRIPIKSRGFPDRRCGHRRTRGNGHALRRL